MRFSRGSLAIILMFWFCGSSLLFAQTAEKLSGEIISSPNVLNANQRQAVSAFAEHWSVRLKLEDDLTVVEARDRLMEPLRGQPSPNFISVYAGIVGPTLTEPLASPRIINRLNTMIVASVMLDQSLVPVVVKGLQDKNPAIRYWAGRATANLGIWGKLTPAQETAILERLAANIVREDNRLVLQSLLMGMSNLNIPEAGKQLLDGLATRVESHVADPGLTAMPEVQALENMCSRIARTLGGNAPDAQTREQLRQILAVLYRYVHTTASVMVKNPPKATDLLNEYQAVLEMGSTWFPWTVGKLTGSEDLGRQFPSYSEPLKTGQWNTVLLIIQDDMKKALTREPLLIKPEDLKTQ